MLLASRLTEEQAKAAGWALLIAGTALSIPIGIEVMGKKNAPAPRNTGLEQAA